MTAPTATPGEVEILDADQVASIAPDQAVPQTDPAASVIVAAGQRALSLPEHPSSEEFYAIAATALMLHQSPAAPREIQDSPHLAFHMAMMARDLRISPSAALQMIDVIPEGGKRPPQLTIKPRMKSAQVQRLGLGEIVIAEQSIEQCVVVAIGPGGCDPLCRQQGMDRHHPTPQHTHDMSTVCRCDYRGRTVYTWADAQAAGYAHHQCQPGQHTSSCMSSDRDSAGCKHNYRTIPARMMYQRASGFCADDYFGMASIGLYDADELGYITDGEGNVMDPTKVQLPAGYEAPEPEGPGSDADIEWVVEIFRRLRIADRDKAGQVIGKYVTDYPDTHPGELTATQLDKATKRIKAMYRDWSDLMARTDLDDDTATAAQAPPAAPSVVPDADSGEDDTEGVPPVSGSDEGTEEFMASAAEALATTTRSGRPKPVGIDEFTGMCHAAEVSVPDMCAVIVTALAAMGRNYGDDPASRTYESLVAVEPEIFGDAADILQTGTVPTADQLVTLAVADDDTGEQA